MNIHFPNSETIAFTRQKLQEIQRDAHGKGGCQEGARRVLGQRSQRETGKGVGAQVGAQKT